MERETVLRHRNRLQSNELEGLRSLLQNKGEHLWGSEKRDLWHCSA